MKTDLLKLLVPLAAATRICAFEVQRWVRARLAGKRGTSEGFGLFIDTTNTITRIAYYTWLILAAVVVGVREAITLIISGFFIVTFVSSLLRKDKLGLWLTGVIGVWPLTVALYWVVLTRT